MIVKAIINTVNSMEFIKTENDRFASSCSQKITGGRQGTHLTAQPSHALTAEHRNAVFSNSQGLTNHGVSIIIFAVLPVSLAPRLACPADRTPILP